MHIPLTKGEQLLMNVINMEKIFYCSIKIDINICARNDFDLIFVLKQYVRKFLSRCTLVGLGEMTKCIR